jgi:hypothetical protein
MECYIWGIALYGVETWTFLGSSEMSCWRRMEKIIGLMVLEMREYYVPSRRRGIS